MNGERARDKGSDGRVRYRLLDKDILTSYQGSHSDQRRGERHVFWLLNEVRNCLQVCILCSGLLRIFQCFTALGSIWALCVSLYRHCSNRQAAVVSEELSQIYRPLYSLSYPHTSPHTHTHWYTNRCFTESGLIMWVSSSQQELTSPYLTASVIAQVDLVGVCTLVCVCI